MTVRLNGLLKDLSEVSLRRTFLYLLLGTATVCPGTIIFFVYETAMFINLPLSKLILLTLSITLPVLVSAILSFVLATRPAPGADAEGRVFIAMLGGGLLAFLEMYAVLGLALLLQWSPHVFVRQVIAVQAGVFLLALLRYWGIGMKERRQSPPDASRPTE